MAGTDRQAGGAEAAAPGGPAIILVRPQLGENIGTAARAMLNCGLSELRLVSPRDGWPSPKALNAASGADAVIGAARLFGSVAEAVADLNRVYATTARPRELIKPVTSPRHAAAELVAAAGAAQRAGVLFGPERTGLTNDELGHADTVIEVPLNPGFASLNLAQAVLIVAYEWRMAALGAGEPRLPLGTTVPATKSEVEAFLRTLEAALDAREFFPTPEMRPTMLRNLRAMIERILPTQQEIQTLFGVVKALQRPPGPRRRGTAED
ncbi:MAG: RNA methyltransferase [Alphaproteobacteria bacterium]